MSRENKSRGEESRAMNSRDAEHARIMRNITNSNQSQFHLDEDIIPNNKQYYFARDTLLGVPDMHRIPELRRKGFTPVPAERHPELCFSDMPWRKSHMDEFIHRGGQVLMEREKIYEEVETNNRAEEQIRLMNSIPGQDHLMNEPTMPMRSYSNETSISKRVSFKGE